MHPRTQILIWYHYIPLYGTTIHHYILKLLASSGSGLRVLKWLQCVAVTRQLAGQSYVQVMANGFRS
jgi:hypothetical protein